MTPQTLLALSDDIIHLILTHLWHTTPTSVCTFARLSKATQRLATPLIWRVVRIGTGNSHVPQSAGRNGDVKFLSREGLVTLLGREDLLGYVRVFELRENGGKGKVVTDDELSELIMEAKGLVRFCWYSESPIRKEALAALEERWQDVELHASRQSDIYSSRALDLNLLNCRNLKVLAHNIAWSRPSLLDIERGSETLASHLDTIDTVLSRSTCNIQILSLSLNILNSIIPIPTATAVDMKTVEIPAMTFENLISINIPADFGNANRAPKAHRILSMHLLSKIHKWKSVRQLHLTGLHAQYAFTILRDRAPNLRRLEMMFPAKFTNRGSLEPKLVAELISNLEKLEHLKIDDMDQEEVDIVWPAIVMQKKRLRTLELYARADLYLKVPVWDATHLDELLTDSSLEHVSIQVSIPTLQEWQATALPLPTSILTTLTLSTHIPVDSDTIFSPTYHYDIGDGSIPPPPLHTEIAQEMAIALFKSAVLAPNRGGSVRLEEVKLCLVRLSVWDRGQTHDVKTLISVRRGAMGLGVEVEMVEDGEDGR